MPSGFVSVGSMLSRYYNIPNKADTFLERIGYPVNEHFTLGQAATGHSIAVCIKQLCAGSSNIIIQGFGTIGKSLAYFIQTRQLGKIVGIIEKDWFISSKNAIDVIKLLKGIDNFVLNNNNDLIIDRRLDHETDESFLSRSLAKLEANFFCPCATRYAVTEKIADVLLNSTFCHNKSNYIISGANNVFANEAVLQKLKSQRTIILPEWLSNSGNTLLFNEVLKLVSNRNPSELLSIITNRLSAFLAQLSEEITKQGDLYEKSYWLIKQIISYQGDLPYSFLKVETQYV